MRLNLGLIAWIALPSIALGQPPATVEQRFQQCMVRRVAPLQRVSTFSFEGHAHSGPEQPLGGKPCDGPKEATYGPLSNTIILSIDPPHVDRLITEGKVIDSGVGPTRQSAFVDFYACSEDKTFGAGGYIDVTVTGKQQRVATATERRRVLSECATEVLGGK